MSTADPIAVVDHLFHRQAGQMVATLTRILGSRHLPPLEDDQLGLLFLTCHPSLNPDPAPALSPSVPEQRWLTARLAVLV